MDNDNLDRDGVESSDEEGFNYSNFEFDSSDDEINDGDGNETNNINIDELNTGESVKLVARETAFDQRIQTFAIVNLKHKDITTFLMPHSRFSQQK